MKQTKISPLAEEILNSLRPADKFDVPSELKKRPEYNEALQELFKNHKIFSYHGCIRHPKNIIPELIGHTSRKVEVYEPSSLSEWADMINTLIETFGPHAILTTEAVLELGY